MFAFISLLFDLSHADVDLVIREFRLIRMGQRAFLRWACRPLGEKPFEKIEGFLDVLLCVFATE